MNISNIQAFVPLLLGLLVAWVIARWLNRRGIDITGLEAIVLGVLAGSYGQNLFTTQAVASLGPLVSFALGILGLQVGSQMRLSIIQSRPTASLRIAVIAALVTAAVVGLICYGLLQFLFEVPRVNATVGILGAAALIASPNVVDQIRKRNSLEGVMTDLIRQTAVFSQVLGVLVFGVILCVFHTGDSTILGTRPLVAVEWLVIAVATGLLVGLLFAWFLGSKSDTEDTLTVALLGMVLFASGFAHALQLSPLLVCTVAGAAVANASPAWGELSNSLDAISRPVTTVILFIAAAIWQFPPAGIWILVMGYILARLLARHMASSFAAMAVSQDDERPVHRVGVSLIAQGGLVVAIALNTWQVFDPETSTIVLTCLLVAGLINELPGVLVVRAVLDDAGELQRGLNTEESMETP